MAFPPCLSMKRLFQGSLGMLAMTFSPCQSRKRRFQGSTRRPNTVPLPTILDASFGPWRLSFPSACRGKCYLRAPWECSRLPFPRACRGKVNFRAPLGSPRATLFRWFWMPASFRPWQLPRQFKARSEQLRAVLGCCVAPRLMDLTFCVAPRLT